MVLGGVLLLLWKQLTSLQDYQKIQRENEKRDREVARDRERVMLETNLSVSMAVSHRLEDKHRNLSWWLCCRDVLTTCVVKRVLLLRKQHVRI